MQLICLLMNAAFAWTVPMDADKWYVVNDTVMGGVSESAVDAREEGGVLFNGTLSLDNNGGFTSTRTEAVPADWAEVSALTLRVVGDGRNYIATVRTRRSEMRRIYYRQPFSTKAGEEQDIVLPIDGFQAYAFGRRVPSAPTLAMLKGQIGSVGVMLADKTPGRFSLTLLGVASIKGEGEGIAVSPLDSHSVSYVFQEAIEQGVPLFNGGQPERCADIYSTAIVNVLLLVSEKMSSEEILQLKEALNKSRSAKTEEERAWVLRRAMDRVILNASTN
jgi:NADH dehydrogenase [ubiquinone] 1 alpha subcomplex assembly factor 1